MLLLLQTLDDGLNFILFFRTIFYGLIDDIKTELNNPWEQLTRCNDDDVFELCESVCVCV